ncbi:MAG: hypothetical protein N5P05_001452 [Chroococcopsis gigantea SAG 12.99]|jgi:uncharacterized protein YybS (DUF2232 family)|nr:DUF2232 domain-containing protein [Chlorogloea purpurea SAG 13.99]MDV2999846.1 hypothetical protein [Chroococcopsis gigantea SAG 12.99]
MAEDDTNWVDLPLEDKQDQSFTSEKAKPMKLVPIKSISTLIMVETAFLASTAGLVWLINYYFPLGPLLRIFFPIPIALAYLRWGSRASWMSALIASLLLSVLMGPTRSIVFLIPHGLMGVQLGVCWRRGANWGFSIFTGALIGALGLFFRFWLFSILLGEDLWLYVITQATNFLDWIFSLLGLLSRPDFALVQTIAIVGIFINNIVYLFAVHLVALLVFDRLGNPIPRPPKWIQTILDYE